MNPSKAIELLKDALKDKWCPWSQDLKDAIQEGIYALEDKQVTERDAEK